MWMGGRRGALLVGSSSDAGNVVRIGNRVKAVYPGARHE